MGLERRKDDDKQSRWFPLEDYFLNYHIDDVIYGYLSYSATYNEETKELYLAPPKYDKLLQDLARALGMEKRRIKAHMEKILSAKLITYDKQKSRYLIKNYGHGEKYSIIHCSLLFFLISGLNRNAVKIAVYLLNKYEYYTDQNDKYYNFTLRELTTILGYADSSSTRGRVNPMIKKVLKWLCLAGVINIKEGYYNSRPCYYLTYCATREDNLKPQSLDELNFLEG